MLGSSSSFKPARKLLRDRLAEAFCAEGGGDGGRRSYVELPRAGAAAVESGSVRPESFAMEPTVEYTAF